MPQTFKINQRNQIANLEQGRYYIYVLGGFGVKIKDFSISFKSENDIIKCEEIFLKVQTYFSRKRAKRIFTLDIPKKEEYEIIFEGEETLQVKPSNLFISSLFQEPLEINQIEILITKKKSLLGL